MALVFAVLAGCGDAGPAKPKLFPVSGKLTLNGAPLGGVTIVFSPTTGGEGSSATVGADGAFKLVSLSGDAGCPAGTYKIVLQASSDAVQKAMANMTPGAGGPPVVEGAFPSEFSTAATSTKEVEVKAESNTINIDL